MPEDLRNDVEDVLQVDVDAYMPVELNEAHQLRTAGRLMLHVRLAKLREIVLATDQYVFANSVGEARDHEGRVNTVTHFLKHSTEQIELDITKAKRLLTPLLAVAPGVGVLIQAVHLDLQASHACLFRHSWSYVLFGVKAKVWRSIPTGTKDFLDRGDVHPSIGAFNAKHVQLRSSQIEQMLLALNDVACAGAGSPSAFPFDSTRAAVAAIPILPLAALAVGIAKSELDQKATVMANFHHLLKDASRHINLLRFAARCLREMDPAVRRGDIDTETGIRNGNIRITAASLVSSMAETMAEWKSLCDGHTVPTSTSIDPSNNNSDSSTSAPSRQGMEIQQPVSANSVVANTMAQQASSSSLADSHEPPFDTMLGNSAEWDNVLTDFITQDAGSSHGQDPFDWASLFGFPSAQLPPSGF